MAESPEKHHLERDLFIVHLCIGIFVIRYYYKVIHQALNIPKKTALSQRLVEFLFSDEFQIEHGLEVGASVLPVYLQLHHLDYVPVDQSDHIVVFVEPFECL